MSVMELLACLVAAIVVFWLVSWYICVYTPRKHMREAIQEATAIMNFTYGPRPKQ